MELVIVFQPAQTTEFKFLRVISVKWLIFNA